MGSAPSEFRAFVAFELIICLLLRTADSARMDCANYCRHVNSGNVPYQAQMYGACGCDYQPYYSNPVPKYNYAPSYRPGYPMLQIQDLSTTVRTIPFNQQPDGTGIYYLPAEMQWPHNYQNSYVDNDYLSPGHTQYLPRGKLVFIPEVSPETKQYNNFDFNIHQSAHIDTRPAFIAGHATNILRGNNDNIAPQATPAPDDHHDNHQYMDVGFRSLLSKNNGKHYKAKETLSLLNMTANEHHLKKCLEFTNLAKSRILHKEDENKGNKTLLYKYKHLSNEEIEEGVSKSCQHSSDVLQKDIKSIRTFKRPTDKIINKENILEKPPHPAIPDESENSQTIEITTNEPKVIIGGRSENEMIETSIESIKDFDKADLKNEKNYIMNLSTDLNVTEELGEKKSTVSTTATKSAGEEVTDEIKTMSTSCKVNPNTKLQDISNETVITQKMDAGNENPTTVKDGDIKTNDTTNVSTAAREDDNEEKAKGIERDDSVKIKTLNDPTKISVIDGNSRVTEINDSQVDSTMITAQGGKMKVLGFNNTIKVNDTHINTTMATDDVDDVNTREMGFNDSVKANDIHVNATKATNEEDNTRETSIYESVKINSTRLNPTLATDKEVNARTMEINDIFKINNTHITDTMATDNVTNPSVTEIYEVNKNQIKATTVISNSKENDGPNVSDHVHTTEKTLSNLKFRINAINISTTPVMEIYEPDIYNSNDNDSIDDGNNGVMLKVNPKEIKILKQVTDEKFGLPQNKSERMEELEGILETQNKGEVVKENDDTAKINEIHVNESTDAIDEEKSTLMGSDDIIISTTPVIEITDTKIYKTNETDDSHENKEVVMNIGLKNLKNTTEVKNEKLKLPENRTEGVNDFNDSATINDDQINLTTKATDENSTLMGLGNLVATTTPVMELPELRASHETDSSDENNKEIIKANDFNDSATINYDHINVTTKATDENSTLMGLRNVIATTTPVTELPELRAFHETDSNDSATINDDDHINITTKTTDENSTLMGLGNVIVTTTPVTELPELRAFHETDSSDENNKVIIQANDFNDSATINDDHINVTTKATDENSTLMELGNVIVTTTPATILPELRASHEIDSSDENNKVIIKANLRKTKILRVEDEKFKLPQNHTVGAKEFDNSDVKTTKAMNKNHIILGFNDASTTITPTTDKNDLETHETERSNENNEVVLKVKSDKPKVSEVNDEQFEFLQEKTVGTEEIDDSLQATSRTESNDKLSTSNMNETDTVMDDVTTKTPDDLRMTDNKSDSNINPTLSTMETEATQSLDDNNSTKRRSQISIATTKHQSLL